MFSMEVHLLEDMEMPAEILALFHRLLHLLHCQHPVQAILYEKNKGG